ncbi:transcription termination/antitermination NusG family protein [Candidatus Nardonella dryophthoridicola]|uniref:transcription termination/antitermination NusG family protein n=1 Tax=Candidatus Nardonella dryophthoridicola TaxID=1971485 RepID=UPI001AD887B4|nr:transcription termination/antitermination NusG family protein [Candidatus Nardonella dryophthoridicola]QTJ62836.1 hypothetical protein JRY34_00895 [Candidatus Nardonella dryophthoridicola]
MKKWYVIKIFSKFKNNIIKNIFNFNKNISLYKYFIDKIVFFNYNKYNYNNNCIYLNFFINNYTIKYINNIPNVLGFINKNKYNYPLYIDDKYINNILISEYNIKLISNKFLKKNDKIIIKNSEFYNFLGTIKKIDFNNFDLVVKIFLLGKKKYVKLNFYEIKKINYYENKTYC